MTWWQRVRRRWRLERELDAELRFHFDRLVGDFMKDGCSEREARQRAREEFGGLEAVKDDCRDARGTRWAHDLSHDVRFAARLLAKDRSFTIIAVLALALGIGVNNTLFAIVNAICIRGLPIERADRVVDISERDQTHPFLLLSPKQFDLLESSSRHTLETVAAYASKPATIVDDGIAAETVTVAYVSSGALRAIRQSPALGRDFRIDDTREGAQAVGILASRLWRGRYAADPAIVGRLVIIGGTPVSVIAVMPDGFRFPDNADVWRPLASLRTVPDSRVLRVYGRLARNATFPQALAEIASLLSRDESPATGTRTSVVPINSRFVGDITNPAWIAFISVGVILVVIACSNVANLLFARGAARGHEMAVRVSLGATRWRIVRQLIIESAMLAALGGLGAIAVSAAGLRLLREAMPQGSLPYWITLTVDARVALMLVAVVLGTVLLCGLAPALHLSRTAPNAVIKETGGPVTDRAGRRWTWIFLTAQLALTVVLLAKLTVTMMQYYVLQTRDHPIDAAHILTFRVSLPPESYRSVDQRREFLARLAQRLEDKRGAIAVSIAATLPSQQGPLRRIVPADHVITKSTPPIQTMPIDAEFFRTLDVGLVAGRAFTREDERSAVMVNQRFAQMFFPGADAVGRRVRLESSGSGTDELRTIIGVTPSFRQQPTFEPDPVVYLPLVPAAASTVLARAADPSTLAAAVRDELHALDATVPADRLMTLEQARWEARWNARVSTEILTTVALVALGLATIGLAALTAYTVVQRRRELGIRLALGATRVHVIALVLKRVVGQVLVGLLVGWMASLAWNRYFETNEGNGPVNMALVGLLLVTVSLAATVWPAVRAGSLDPVTVLRQD